MAVHSLSTCSIFLYSSSSGIFYSLLHEMPHSYSRHDTSIQNLILQPFDFLPRDAHFLSFTFLIVPSKDLSFFSVSGFVVTVLSSFLREHSRHHTPAFSHSCSQFVTSHAPMFFNFAIDHGTFPGFSHACSVSHTACTCTFRPNHRSAPICDLCLIFLSHELP